MSMQQAIEQLYSTNHHDDLLNGFLSAAHGYGKKKYRLFSFKAKTFYIKPDFFFVVLPNHLCHAIYSYRKIQCTHTYGARRSTIMRLLRLAERSMRLY